MTGRLLRRWQRRGMTCSQVGHTSSVSSPIRSAGAGVSASASLSPAWRQRLVWCGERRLAEVCQECQVLVMLSCLVARRG